MRRIFRTASVLMLVLGVASTDVDGALPGYDVRYVDVVIMDPSGERATLPGRRFIVIRFEPLDAHTEAGQPTVSRAVKRLDLQAVRAYQVVGDFEAVVSVAIGLDEDHRVPFRVGSLTGPNRIYVDVSD